MKILDEIKTSNRKPKELIAYLAEEVKKNENLFNQLIEGLEVGSDVERGTCAELIKQVTKDKPEYALSYIDILIKYINYKAPRVKWGTSEAIANIAQKFSNKTEKAIPNLIVNTKDASTVVRWCAAFALTEIAKNENNLAKRLVPMFKDFVEKEQNNGVRNVYLKALKIIGK